MDMPPYMRRSDQGTLLEIAVQPRSSRDELAGIHNGRLKVRLTAAPVEGEANKECVRFLAKCLGVARADVEIVQGHKSRRKVVLVRGLSPEALETVLNEAGFDWKGDA